MMVNIGYEQERFKNITEKEAKKQEEKTTEEKNEANGKTNLVLQEYERALKIVSRSFLIPGVPKPDIGGMLIKSSSI